MDRQQCGFFSTVGMANLQMRTACALSAIRWRVKFAHEHRPKTRKRISITSSKNARSRYLVLEGWEVSAIHAYRAQIKEGYAILKDGAFHLIGAHISPLEAASTHVNWIRCTRKLLLNRDEITEAHRPRGTTRLHAGAANLHFNKGRICSKWVLSSRQEQSDKRETEKERDWKREQQQKLMKRHAQCSGSLSRAG